MCGINSKTITKHLRDLENESIISRTVYPEVPPRVEYALTEPGREILPIIDEMLIWGGKFRQPPEMTGCESAKVTMITE